jgi:rSAM/selenodomain-associated transferase 1
MVRIILFAKRPVEGRVKTRLVPPLSRSQALGLHRAFLADGIAFLRSLRSATRTVELCLDGAWHDGDAPEGLPLTRQEGADLGARMLHAFERSHEEGNVATVILGADAPTLPRSRVEEALEVLASGAGVVLCPALDGGYVLIGSRRPRRELFHSIPWGGPAVLETTRRRAEKARIPLHELEPWYDVDVAADLERLVRDLSSGAHPGRAEETRRFLEREFRQGGATGAR